MRATLEALGRRLRHLLVLWWRDLHPVMAIRVPLPYPLLREPAARPSGPGQAEPAGAEPDLFSGRAPRRMVPDDRP
ncbi:MULTISPECIES: hypothetical protein [unclassified Kitasatospora]|uniref:hypothetical protein n=1 Tax=unclassified Kitasatospora TaxID=2633591 RepID=UPI0007096978|nr:MULTISPECIES: hypothetical protein [unclassified Kitasatospora]KQV19517.1 hypothetical protein ASC99_22790 [Kitasatospora sp. Root107]KRB72884.1 hypothetical protein ASE03_21685 [Kitasatospora sp. Root187]